MNLPTMVPQPPKHPAHVSDPLRCKWRSLQGEHHYQLREAYNNRFEGVLELKSYWQLDNVATGLWPVQTAEEFGWLVQEIVAAYEQHIEGYRPETAELPIKKNPGGLDRGCTA